MNETTITIDTEVKNQKLVIHIKGNLDVHNVHICEKPLMEKIRNNSEKFAIISLKNVNFVSSAGLRILVTSLKICEEKGIELRISDMKDPVKKVFQLVDMQTLFHIYPTLSEALN